MLFLLTIILAVEAAKFPDCKAGLTCWADSSCLLSPSNRQGLFVIDHTTDIKKDCIALFKLHIYSEHHYHISMESLKEDITSIELAAQANAFAQVPDTKLFSCQREGTSSVKAPDATKLLKSNFNPLKCEFEVINKDTTAQPIFPIKEYWFYVVTTSNGQSTNKNTPTPKRELILDRFCEKNEILVPQSDFNEDKNYEKVTYTFGKVNCSNKVYTLEYREDGDKGYEEVDEILCDHQSGGAFTTVPAKGQGVTEDVDVRCAADADFFCDYKPAVKPGLTDDQKELEVDLPNIKIHPVKKGTVKCPDKYNFLVLAGRKPQKDFEIKCKNHGGNMRWTVNDTVLHKTGPFVHCVKNVDCHVMNKIPRENLIGSHLDDKFNPACHQGGTFKIKQGSANEIDVESVKCDADTGEYKYVKKDEEYSVAPGSIFTCTYDDPNKENEEENAATMKMTGVTVFLVVFFVVAAIAGIVLFFRWRQLKQMEKQLKMSSAIDEKRFAMKEEESGQTKKENGDLLANDFLSCKKREESTKFKTYDKYDKLESKKVRKEEDVFPILMENDKNRGLRKVEKLPMEKNETILHHEQAADAAAAKRKEKEDGEKEGAKTDSKKNV